VLRGELSRRAKQLEGQGFGVHAQDRNGGSCSASCVRARPSTASTSGFGGSWGENTICFAVGSGRMSSTGINATAIVEWDRERGLRW